MQVLGTLTILPTEIRRLIYSIEQTASYLLGICKAMQKDIETALDNLRCSLPINGKELLLYLHTAKEKNHSYYVRSYIPQTLSVDTICGIAESMASTETITGIQLKLTTRRHVGRYYPHNTISYYKTDTTSWAVEEISVDYRSKFLKTVSVLLPSSSVAIDLLLSRFPTSVPYNVRRIKAHNTYIRLLRAILDDISRTVDNNASMLFGKKLLPDSLTYTSEKVANYDDIRKKYLKDGTSRQRWTEFVRQFVTMYACFRNEDLITAPFRLATLSRFTMRLSSFTTSIIRKLGNPQPTQLDSGTNTKTPTKYTMPTCWQVSQYLTNLIAKGDNFFMTFAILIDSEPLHEIVVYIKFKNNKICVSSGPEVGRRVPLQESQGLTRLLFRLDANRDKVCILPFLGTTALEIYNKNIVGYCHALRDYLEELLKPLGIDLYDFLHWSPDGMYACKNRLESTLAGIPESKREYLARVNKILLMLLGLDTQKEMIVSTGEILGCCSAMLD